MKKRVSKKSSPVIFPCCTITEDRFTWLRYYSTTGGAARFDVVDNTMYAVKRLAAISEMFNPDGTFNGKNERAERYAICLAHEKKFEGAVEMFEAIIGDEKEYFVSNQGKLEPVANKAGMLGFEGIFQYANACMEVKGKEKNALKAFAKIAKNVPANCFPIRLQDVLVDALRILLEHKIEKIGELNLLQKYDEAKEHQY